MPEGDCFREQIINIKKGKTESAFFANGDLNELKAENIAIAINSENSKVSSITIIDNPILDEGVKALATAISNNHNITQILLTECMITNIGAKYIAKAIRKNQNIQSVTLRGNLIDDEGAKLINDASKGHPSLVNIDLDQNHVSPEMQAEIKKTLSYEEKEEFWAKERENGLRAVAAKDNPKKTLHDGADVIAAISATNRISTPLGTPKLRRSNALETGDQTLDAPKTSDNKLSTPEPKVDNGGRRSPKSPKKSPKVLRKSSESPTRPSEPLFPALTKKVKNARNVIVSWFSPSRNSADGHVIDEELMVTLKKLHDVFNGQGQLDKLGPDYELKIINTELAGKLEELGSHKVNLQALDKFTDDMSSVISDPEKVKEFKENIFGSLELLNQSLKDDKQLKEVFRSHPGAQEYYESVVQGLVGVHLAGQVLKTGSVEAAASQFASVTGHILKGLAAAIPLGGAMDFIGELINDRSRSNTTKNISKYANLALTPVDMSNIAKTVASKLVQQRTNEGKLDYRSDLKQMLTEFSKNSNGVEGSDMTARKLIGYATGREVEVTVNNPNFSSISPSSAVSEEVNLSGVSPELQAVIAGGSFNVVFAELFEKKLEEIRTKMAQEQSEKFEEQNEKFEQLSEENKRKVSAHVVTSQQAEIDRLQRELDSVRKKTPQSPDSDIQGAGASVQKLLNRRSNAPESERFGPNPVDTANNDEAIRNVAMATAQNQEDIRRQDSDMRRTNTMATANRERINTVTDGVKELTNRLKRATDWIEKKEAGSQSKCIIS